MVVIARREASGRHFIVLGALGVAGRVDTRLSCAAYLLLLRIGSSVVASASAFLVPPVLVQYRGFPYLTGRKLALRRLCTIHYLHRAVDLLVITVVSVVLAALE